MWLPLQQLTGMVQFAVSIAGGLPEVCSAAPAARRSHAAPAAAVDHLLLPAGAVISDGMLWLMWRVASIACRMVLVA
jgi:hypothetical protein